MSIHKLTGTVSSREVLLDGERLDPGPSQKVHNHSPDGFNWGYGGSGPAQLALAVVLAITGKSDGYQEFKWAHIANLKQNESFQIEFEL